MLIAIPLLLIPVMLYNIVVLFGGSGEGAVNGDALLLRELLGNLLDNALRYGGGRGAIEVSVTAAVAGPVLGVADAGPGIPPSEAGRVTERFYRIPGSPGDGCGLGLAIVKEIADRHRAELAIGTGAARGQPAIQRGACTADMQVAGGTGGEAGTDGHGNTGSGMRSILACSLRIAP